MKPASKLEQSMCKAFWSAALLSADAESAEKAVHDAIDSLDPEEFSSDAFLFRVLNLSIQRSGRAFHSQKTERGQTLSMLPVQLQHVMRLPTLLRHCFVLRVLLALPEEVSASMLHLDIPTLREITSAAASSLAGLSEQGSLTAVQGFTWRSAGA